jgi:hypothetical protein
MPFGASNCWSVTRGMRIPTFAYAHWTSPEQSKPLFGDEPPHLYGVPTYFFASASAASACAPATVSTSPSSASGSALLLRARRSDRPRSSRALSSCA